NGTLGAAFMIAGTYAQGDLPITPDDHWTLMKEVYCCEGGHFKVAEHPEGLATVNELLGYPQSFAYGQVNGMLNLTVAYLAALNNAPPTAPAFPLSGPPAGVVSHCVVITGRSRCSASTTCCRSGRGACASASASPRQC